MSPFTWKTLISSLCWNLTLGTVFIPHATAILSTNCLKERMVKPNNKPPTYTKLRASTGLFWRNSKGNFFAARVTVQLSH